MIIFIVPGPPKNVKIVQTVSKSPKSLLFYMVLGFRYRYLRRVFHHEALGLSEIVCQLPRAMVCDASHVSSSLDSLKGFYAAY